MTKAKRCLRRIVTVESLAGGRVRWELECGHQIGKRASIPVPERTRCLSCEESQVQG